MKKKDFDYIATLLRDETGWEVLEKDYYVIERKTSNFVRQEGYGSTDLLLADLKRGKKLLIERLVEYVVHSDSRFFRDLDVFDRFEKFVLPNIKEAYSSAKKINIWSCGCASGQEVYSILMALKKNGFLEDWDIKVVGTDFSSRSLAVASKGVYNNFDIQTGLNIKDIVENFTQKGNEWQINYDLSQHAEFRKYNMLEGIVFNNKFDIVFCRNMLKYFKKDIQKEAIKKIWETQRAGGLLYCGLNEDVFEIETYYEKVKGFECLYQAKEIEKDVVFNDSEKTDEKPSFKKPEEFEKLF